MKILIKIDINIGGKYLISLKKVIDAIKRDNKLSKDISIKIEPYEFTINEKMQIQKEGIEFVYSKIENNPTRNYDSLIFIPGPSINLKGNYLWYGTENEKSLVMVISSFLFKNLIEGKLEFGAYIFVLYSQFLTRVAVDIEPHQKSRNCLNDHCAYQVELLNVFENKEGVLCNECMNSIILKYKRYYTIAKKLIENIRQFYYLKKFEPKITIQKKGYPKKKKTKKLIIKSNIISERGNWYEFEIYLAKKCANMANLYKKLDEKLLNEKSEIKGYSIYEVGGGWRGDIEINENDKKTKTDWQTLYELQQKYDGKNVFKDIIRPLINRNGKRYAIYDETSIVLRIVANTKKKITKLDPKLVKILGEVQDVCQEIVKKEKSIFFTIKKLEKKGSIVEI